MPEAALIKGLSWDVVVVGAGNAALCAALSAREQGARVLVMEKATRSGQSGNCPFTGGGFRFAHNGARDLQRLVSDPPQGGLTKQDVAPYSAQDFRRQLREVTRGETYPDLMETLISKSLPTIEWMGSVGVEWVLPDRPSSERAASTIPSSVGLSARDGGPGLLRMLTASARHHGIEILYETEMVRLLRHPGGPVTGVVVRDADGEHEVDSRSVVLACGGFEASAEMRAEHLGSGWERARVRGSAYNTGDGHRAALDVGAGSAGEWSGCHATPVDVDAPATGVLELTSSMTRRSYPLGITVNRQGRRFADEGVGFAEQTFVEMGRAILEQEGGVAYQLFDSGAARLLDPVYGSAEPVRAPSISELAHRLDIDSLALEAAVDSYNHQAHEGDYGPRLLDGFSTSDLEPRKSNWAIKIDSPPYVAFAVTGGITYTYGGVRISPRAEVLDKVGAPIPGLFAAGEIVGGIFFHNSLRGAGLMHGSVFGRLAGAGAARSA